MPKARTNHLWASLPQKKIHFWINLAFFFVFTVAFASCKKQPTNNAPSANATHPQLLPSHPPPFPSPEATPSNIDSPTVDTATELSTAEQELIPIPTTSPPAVTPTPIPYIPRKEVDVSRFYNGITIESAVQFQQSPYTASIERRSLGSYLLKMELSIQIPSPALALEQVKANDPTLDSILPNLEFLLETAQVSPAFHRIYENKVQYIRRRLGRLEEILSRHNFYDCDTILQIQNPQTGRRALLISADMDLNEDGSDGDRNFRVEPTSPFFQPTTSYRWPKQTQRPNQFLEPTEKRLAEIRKRLLNPNEKDRQQLTREQELLTLRLRELKRWSFLISAADPYIVLPGFLLRSEDSPFKPALGDFAAVVHYGKILPAIVGDAGPSYKAGEASLRICREIQPLTSANRRAVSDIHVHYFVFPGTAEAERSPPDLEKWNARVRELWQELGGDPAAVHTWENIVPPWPEEIPQPLESPTPTASSTPDSTPPPQPSAESHSLSPTSSQCPNQ